MVLSGKEICNPTKKCRPSAEGISHRTEALTLLALNKVMKQFTSLELEGVKAAFLEVK